MRLSIPTKIAAGALVLVTVAVAIHSCTKYQKGFLSPYITYLETSYTFGKGRVASSDALDPDGSSIPLHVELVHVYDANGKLWDSVFLKSYPVTTWISQYIPTVDTTFDQIIALQQVQQLPGISVNSVSGVIQSNAASLNLPAGT
jgi:hypothetical protein